MPLWKKYHIARSVEEALQVMTAAPGACRAIAGGTDLLLDLQQGRLPPVDTLVDVTAIPELTCLEMRESGLFIGAAVPLSEIAASQLVMQHACALVDACDLIGGPQVRNMATLGGNVAHALPAADGTIALMALDAQVEIGAYQSGLRSIPLGQLFTGPGQSILNPRHELLVGFRLPASKPGQASAFARVMRPQGVALPVLNMAVWLERRDDRIQDIHIAVGPAGPVPRRGLAAEKILCGKPFAEVFKLQALSALLAEVTLRTSPHRATASYRRHLMGVLFAGVLQQAWQRSGASTP